MHARLRPDDPDAARLFDLLEHARCEGGAARAYPGLVDNLTAHHLERLARADLLGAHLASLIPLAEGLRMVLRDSFVGRPEPSVQTAGFRMWDGWLRARFAPLIDTLAAELGDQQTYATAARALIDALFAELSSRGRHVRHLDPTAPEDTPGDDGEALRETDDPARAALFDPGDDTGRAPERDAGPVAGRPTPAAPYRAFTTRHDRVVRAQDLFDHAALTARRHALDETRATYRREVTRLAGRLQRRLLAQRARHWEFDLDDGLIDASRLDRVVLSPGFASAYKQEADSPFRDTLVTLLIDNSGSMRGRPIETACITADIVAAALEHCEIATEVLGFTTAAWKGGQAARDWKAAGKPANPGRLGDLLHIVYKDAETPLRRARDALCAMLTPALLKENIDGEALAWAAGRMLRAPQARRLLIVISDGAPVDQATIEANDDKRLLDRNLRDTIAWIERETRIELAAIGIRHEVGDYYRNAIRIDSAEELADAVIALIDNSLNAR
ncbi:MAG: cobaltochelatase subunit CobT [Maritimibacter sp.]|nr:cobaltochelatase subunit CobT [Maritimibacter sp.]